MNRTVFPLLLLSLVLLVPPASARPRVLLLDRASDVALMDLTGCPEQLIAGVLRGDPKAIREWLNPPKVGETWAAFAKRWDNEKKGDIERGGVANFLNKKHAPLHPWAGVIMQLGGGTNWLGELVLAPLMWMLKDYDAILAKQLAAYGLTEKDGIRPGRPFKTPSGELKFLGWDQDPEADWVALDVSRDPRLVGRMLRAGYAFVGEGDTAGHDLFGHCGGFLEHPIYMAKIRQLMQQPSRLSKHDFYVRFVYLFEGLSWVRRDKLENVRELLDPMLNGDELVTVKRLMEKFEDDSDANLVSAAKRVTDAYPGLIDHMGGTVREVHSMEGYMQRGEIRHSLAILQFETQLNLLEYKKDPSNMPLRKGLAWRLAKLQIALRESARIDAMEFIDQLMSVERAQQPDVYRMFVQTGLAESDGYYRIQRDMMGYVQKFFDGPGLIHRSLERGLNETDLPEFTFRDI